MRLGLGIDLSALSFESLDRQPWDYDLTTGLLPPVLSVSRATSGSRISETGLIEIQAANTPRFDYDAINHTCRGLLVEPQCTYWGVDSEAHETANWSLSGGIQVSNLIDNSPLRGSDSISRVGVGTLSYSSLYIATSNNYSGRIFQSWIIRNYDSSDGRIVLRDNTAAASFNCVINWANPGSAGSDIASMTLSTATAGLSAYAYGFFKLSAGWWCIWLSGLHVSGDSVSPRIDPSQSPIGKSIDIAATWIISDQFNYCPSYLPTNYGVSVTRDADVPVLRDTSRPYRVTYTPLAGGAAQIQDVAAGAQPPALPGRWTRVQQL